MAAKATPDQLPDPRANLWDFIASYLRFQRNARRLSCENLGRVLGCSKAKVSRIEIGRERLDWKLATALDTAWNTGSLFENLVWYASIGHDPEWFAQFLHLERQAEAISTFRAEVIPGIVQTEAYARELLMLGDPRQADVRLKERIERQLVLDREPAPHLSVILSQAAIEWPVGSPAIMCEQLARLLELQRLHNVTIRIVPRTWETGAYPGLDGSFTIMSGDNFGQVAYTESPEGGRLVSSPPDVRSFAVRLDRISAKALPEGSSRDLLMTMLEAYGSEQSA